MQELPVDILIEAYLNGYFPMADPDTGGLDWYRPDPRAILDLDSLHVPKSLARTIQSGRFDIRTDTCFDAVVAACGESALGRETTWIDNRIAAACGELHRRGLAHSVEAWRAGRLVGGLYGVRLGGAFFGESMFSRPSIGGRDASKVCLAWLVGHLQTIGACLLDIQFLTPHLERLGATEVDLKDYLSRLETATALACHWNPHPTHSPPRSTAG
jgi:leucyl/phenylalanyl-tRNA--protein transferase